MTVSSKKLKYLILINLISIVILIFVGGSVRSSESGMGCPDWPTCFGQIIPPISESQLPPNYQEIYAQRGYADNRFNVFKTWTEYFNRLMGSLVGILAIVSFIAFLLSQVSTRLKALTGIALLLIILQGLIGAKLIATNLHPLIITTHMVVALFILLLYLLIYNSEQINPLVHSNASTTVNLKSMVFLLLLVFIQVILGALVREQIDVQMLLKIPREKWFGTLDSKIAVHILNALVIFIMGWLIWVKMKVQKIDTLIVKNFTIANILVSSNLLFGFILAFFDFPSFAQPIHLLFANLIFIFYAQALIVSINMQSQKNIINH